MDTSKEILCDCNPCNCANCACVGPASQERCACGADCGCGDTCACGQSE